MQQQLIINLGEKGQACFQLVMDASGLMIHPQNAAGQKVFADELALIFEHNRNSIWKMPFSIKIGEN